MASQHPLMTVAEVAEHLRVSTMTVYRLIQREELSALRIGRSYRVEREALDAYLSSDSVVDHAPGEGSS